MNQTFLKVVLRVIGTLSGVAGVAALFFASYVLVRAELDVNGWRLALNLFSLLLGSYLVYVGYLVWFRLSPLAVRHVCGLLGMYVFSLAMKLVDVRSDPSSPWASVAFLGCLFGVYFGYKAVSRWLSRQLFPDPSPDVQA